MPWAVMVSKPTALDIKHVRSPPMLMIVFSAGGTMCFNNEAEKMTVTYQPLHLDSVAINIVMYYFNYNSDSYLSNYSMSWNLIQTFILMAFFNP